MPDLQLFSAPAATTARLQLPQPGPAGRGGSGGFMMTTSSSWRGPLAGFHAPSPWWAVADAGRAANDWPIVGHPAPGLGVACAGAVCGSGCVSTRRTALEVGIVFDGSLCSARHCPAISVWRAGSVRGRWLGAGSPEPRARGRAGVAGRGRLGRCAPSRRRLALRAGTGLTAEASGALLGDLQVQRFTSPACGGSVTIAGARWQDLRLAPCARRIGRACRSSGSPPSACR